MIVALFSSIALPGYSELRPTIALVSDTSVIGSEGRNVQLFIELVTGDIEGRLLEDNRYLVTVYENSEDPEEVVDALDTDGAVFVRAAARRDGTVRLEVDVWVRDNGGFEISREHDIVTGIDRFSDARVIAEEAADAVNDVFPLPAILEFENRGADDSYSVFLDGEYVGGNISRLALSAGRYDLSVRRREFDREIIVGERSLNLEPDDYYRVVFEMEQIGEGPVAVVPDPGKVEPWNYRLGVHAGGLFSSDRNGDYDQLLLEQGAAGMLSMSWNDVFFRFNVVGLETGIVYLGWDEYAAGDNVTLRVDGGYIPLMAFTGLELGVPGVADVAVRTGGGLSLTATNALLPSDEQDWQNRIPPWDQWGVAFATRSMVEFGVQAVPGWRLSFGIALDGLFEVQTTRYYTRLGLNVGTGIQF